MIKILPIVGLLLFVSACEGEKKTENKEPQKTNTLETTATDKDTITFTLEDIDEKSYCRLVEKAGYCKKNGFGSWAQDSLNEIKLLKDNRRVVKRKGNKLTFTIGKNNLEYKNVRDEMSGEYVIYRLVDMNDEYAVLALLYYEGHEYMVLNHKTGKSFKTWGRPIFNASKSMVASGNYDLAAGYSNNGLQVFTNENGKWDLKMARLLDDWGPSGLWWVNDSVIASMKNRMIETSKGATDTTTFVKILLKKEKIN
ncbi:MAG TPA: hypothetical protein VD905_03565 [Flavobacteriales bacterium]|nr:hypothetical protein [Flavobacteriales bacterium]